MRAARKQPGRFGIETGIWQTSAQFRRVRQAPRQRKAGIEVQFATPPVIEYPIGDVGILLDFDDLHAGADGMNGAGRDVEEVASPDREPFHQVDDRTVERRETQRLGCNGGFQAYAEDGIRRGSRHQPPLLLAR
ncbi:hypothetical protein CBR61_08600 [Porphyrobacter sp. CACIAM 03H1]|nr:hypothetical protein CBR61_08600 [Porphyrobacter sp. CACIAM 03H1]